MAIQGQPAPTSYGTFKDTLFEFFKLLEAPIEQKRLNLHVVKGHLTIGIGFEGSATRGIMSNLACTTILIALAKTMNNGKPRNVMPVDFRT
jgi:hypothetical protein